MVDKSKIIKGKTPVIDRNQKEPEPEKESNRIEDHPGIEYVYEFINRGNTIIEDKIVESITDLCGTLNSIYPEHKMWPVYITRLKKRIKSAQGGYMLKDGTVYYADGRPLQPLPLRVSLETIIHIALENAVNNPDKVGLREALHAVEIILKNKTLADADAVKDVWTAFVQGSGKIGVRPGSKRGKIEEPQPAPPPPELLALMENDGDDSLDFEDDEEDE